MPSLDPLDLPVALRAVDAAQAPYPGTLRATDPPTLWVDAEEAGADALWDLALDEHLLAPLDLARTPDGVALVLPACPTSLTAFVDRRVGVGEDEAVTIAVSLLRGCAAAVRRGREHGTWWVTSDGRPVLALGGSSDAAAEAAAIIAGLAAHSGAGLGAGLRAAAELLADPRALRRGREDAETALFEAAVPGPLRLDGAPLRARELAVATRMTAVDVAAHVDPGIAERVRASLGAVVASVQTWRERHRPRAAERPEPATKPRRPAPLLVGGAVAAVIAVAGAAWPAPADDRSAPMQEGRTRSDSPGAAEPSPARTPESDVAAEATIGPGAAEAGAGALTAYAACSDDPCRALLREDPSRTLPAGAATTAAPDRVIDLVDEYGGVAVLRVTAAGWTPQFAVVVGEPGDDAGRTWLIRDVYDAADQP